MTLPLLAAGALGGCLILLRRNMSGLDCVLAFFIGASTLNGVALVSSGAAIGLAGFAVGSCVATGWMIFSWWWAEGDRTRRLRRQLFLFASMLLGSVLARASGDAGGPDGMVHWLQDAFGWSLHTAEVATVVFRKCVHFSYYGLIGWTAFRGAIGFETPLKRAVWFALLWTLTYAAFDEISQLASALRTGSMLDVLLDLAGASAFIFLSARRPAVRSSLPPKPIPTPERKNR